MTGGMPEVDFDATLPYSDTTDDDELMTYFIDRVFDFIHSKPNLNYLLDWTTQLDSQNGMDGVNITLRFINPKTFPDIEEPDGAEGFEFDGDLFKGDQNGGLNK